nr:immunoglobulin heavy chain junction region [Mus musculus]
CARGPGYFDVW